MSEPLDKEALRRDSRCLIGAAVSKEAIPTDLTIIKSARGITVADIDGRDYLDGLSGIWVVNIGHGNTSVIDAVVDQMRQFSFSWPEGTLNAPAIRLAKLLTEITPPRMTAVKFVNSGSEAAETALKLVRQYFFQTGCPRKTKIISRYLSWHGSTMGALSMGGMTDWKEPFAPLAAIPYQRPRVWPIYHKYSMET